MKLPIYLYGSSVLRQPTREITADYPNLDKLIADMFETMYYADGVGLAAPQIGLSIRLIVLDGSEIADDFPELTGFKRVLINPRIIEKSTETCLYSEGCLSLPAIHTDIERPKIIKVAYLDPHFEPKEETLDGFASRLVQHEYSHLEGELFVDFAPAIRKKMLESKLLALSKGKTNAGYKTKLVK